MLTTNAAKMLWCDGRNEVAMKIGYVCMAARSPSREYGIRENSAGVGKKVTEVTGPKKSAANPYQQRLPVI